MVEPSHSLPSSQLPEKEESVEGKPIQAEYVDAEIAQIYHRQCSMSQEPIEVPGAEEPKASQALARIKITYPNRIHQRWDLVDVDLGNKKKGNKESESNCHIS